MLTGEVENGTLADTPSYAMSYIVQVSVRRSFPSLYKSSQVNVSGLPFFLKRDETGEGRRGCAAVFWAHLAKAGITLTSGGSGGSGGSGRVSIYRYGLAAEWLT